MNLSRHPKFIRQTGLPAFEVLVDLAAENLKMGTKEDYNRELQRVLGGDQC